MFRLKTLLLAMLGLNLLAGTVLGYNQCTADHSDPACMEEAKKQFYQDTFHVAAEKVPEAVAQNTDISSSAEESPYRFNQPKVALELLKQLDVFSAVGPKDVKKTNYTFVAGGFKVNNEYCDQHRELIVEHPEIIFNQNNVISNFWKWHKFRKQVIDLMNATDLHPEISMWHGPKDYRYDMKLNANVFYMFNLFFYKRQVGKQFSCLSQASNHIPGHEKMYRKDRVAEALVDYAKTYETRPQCFNFEKWFPKTFILNQEEQCKLFFEEFLSPKYQELKAERNIVYFRKIGAGVHEGKGVFPVNDAEELYLQKKYKNGTLCGKIKANNLIQYNVHNLLLVKNRKFGFRSFLLVASTNPLIAYYHNGYARLSLNEYDSKSNEKKTFVTNIGVNLKEASKGTEWEQLTAAEIQDKTCWSMEDFQQHMLDIGRTNDTNYLNNTLKPEFKKVMTHLLRMASGNYQRKSSLFETYGLDFVMDDNMNLWFIEANTKPLVNGFTEGSTVLLNRMLIDTFEIVRNLLKSRMKRVILYINTLTEEVEAGKNPLADLDARREEFRKLSMNYFEPEFEISSDNTFERIINENDSGVKRYHGLIPKKCL